MHDKNVAGSHFPVVLYRCSIRFSAAQSEPKVPCKDKQDHETITFSHSEHANDRGKDEEAAAGELHLFDLSRR